jgi:endonuclease/exonuclease/phosphatase family metal-dependent hydrolase
MRKILPFLAVCAVLFLFLIQSAGTLVESIYILDLMHTSLDEKALGLLFFFAPLGLLALRGRTPGWLAWGATLLLAAARGLTPYLSTAGRLVSAGLATAAALVLLALLASARTKTAGVKDAQTTFAPGLAVSAGLALAVCLSVLLRAMNFSIDASLTRAGGWLGWGLGLLLLWGLARLEWPAWSPAREKRLGLAPALLGLFLVFTLVYFAFSAPAVIARWTGGSYPWIAGAVSLLAAGWAWLAVCRPRLAERLPRRLLFAWNLAFALSLAFTLLSQRVAFPQQLGETAAVSGAISLPQAVALGLMLLLYPVLFLDLRLFAARIWRHAPEPARLVPGMLLGSGALVVLVFINIFTNVWGYIDPVSTPFRNQYWLPFFLAAAGITFLVGRGETGREKPARGAFSWGWTALLAALFLAGAGLTLRGAPAPAAPSEADSLVVMTYNIQAGNDAAAEPAYERQLALIRRVAPDILALQESDTARISLNNNDFVRYFAASLGYHAYYGPTTVAGTFGTAILSRYPLENPDVLFSYSDSDEIGTARAEVVAAGRRFSIYNVHPDGSDAARLAFAQTLLAEAQGKTNVIVLGDFNTRKDEPGYLLFDQAYANAWTTVYPGEISPDGIDMSGRKRIDHIFVSPDLRVGGAWYVLAPESQTDHPVHWAEISWEE